MMRVLYVNVHNPAYPRNRLIRGYLAEKGVHIDVVARSNSSSFVLDALKLVWRSAFRREGYDLIILSELGVQFSLAAKVVAMRFKCALIIDAFVGMYETNVGDWAEVEPNSLKSRIYALVDRIASRVSAFRLIDTDVRAAQLDACGGSPALVIPVGAPTWARPRPSGVKTTGLRLLFYGNYAPLHGIPYVLERLTECRDLVDSVVFVGDGSLRPAIERQARALELTDVIQFRGSVPEAGLADLIAECDVVLGIFGTSEKAQGVIANKVWQGVASGKIVITRRSAALTEISQIAPSSILTVDLSNPGSFDDALVEAGRRIACGEVPAATVAADLDAYVYRRMEIAFSTMVELVESRR
ncbi:glycosyltransferase [Rhodococcus fascians]|nr:glycosyltransferase [Rhodococcus fascians]MBY4021070.1 glycosyltransferase [Rhodococcus fascians]